MNKTDESIQLAVQRMLDATPASTFQGCTEIRETWNRVRNTLYAGDSRLRTCSNEGLYVYYKAWRQSIHSSLIAETKGREVKIKTHAKLDRSTGEDLLATNPPRSTIRAILDAMGL